jgi:hypothetical protein
MSSLSLDRELKFQAATEPTKKKKQNKRFLCTQIQVLICAKHYVGIQSKKIYRSQHLTYGCAKQVGLNLG